MQRWKYFFEGRLFGVCQFLGDVLGISSSYIRIFFIYFTFISVPSSAIAYLVLAFWLNVHRFFSRNPIKE